MADTRVLHVVTDLDPGGTERMLARLVAATQGRGLVHEVVSLKGDGIVTEALRASGVEAHGLDLRGVASSPAAVARLAASVRRFAPDVVQCWMYHANLIGGLAARTATRAPILWNLRSNSLRCRDLGFRTAAIARGTALLSRWLPRRIVCPSEATRVLHAAAGYAANAMVVIANGFDTELFRPSDRVRKETRRRLGVAPTDRLIGIVANVRAIKNHRTFVAAAGRLAADDVRFVLCGHGAVAENAELLSWIRETDRADRFLLLGSIERVHELLPALDVFTLCSSDESFPNALGEAMASGLPCVSTDVGGVRELGAESVRLVPRADPAALAAAWRELLEAPPEQRKRLGAAARRRITERFSMRTAAERYEALYDEVSSCAIDPRSARSAPSPEAGIC